MHADEPAKSSEIGFLQYYLKELTSLEDDCAEFAASYPQAAGNLGMGSEGSTDPHVRQLIEAVAFIAARLKRQIDTVPGHLANGLLQSVAPHLVAPVPAMSVAKFVPLSDKLDAAGATPPGALRLRAAAPGGECLFTACTHDIRLWPLELEAFWAGAGSSAQAVPGFDGQNGFALKLAHPSRKMAQDAPGDLSFFISGPLNRALAAIEALMLGVREIRMVALDGAWSVAVAPEQIEALGFDPAHRLIPAPHAGTQAGALALEFLSFPRRFCFFKVSGLRCPVPARGFFVVFAMDRQWMPALEAVKQNIQINCVPIVNLFTRKSVALRIEGGREQHLIPRGEPGRGQWDVFAVDRVRLIEREKETDIPPFQFDGPGPDDGVSWQGVRNERLGHTFGHASLAVQFAGLAQAQRLRDPDMAMLDLTCTHCEAPAGLQAGQALEVQGWDGGYRAVLELAPTAYVPPVLAGSAGINEILQMLQWRSSGPDSLAADVRRYLTVHDRAPSPYSAALVAALQDIERQVVGMPWAGAPSGVGLGMGCRYSIRFRSGAEALGSRYLFACLVRRILVQMHQMPMPLEVAAHDSNGEWRHVG